jgi:glycosyltransferase involved in cell wall biosynthesis
MPAISNSIAKCCMPERRSPVTTDLLVFADDWGRHPSSCQHLVRHLLSRHGVLWANTIGTRPPRCDWATLRRGLEKFRQWLRPPHDIKSLPANLRVLNPRMWPWFSSSMARRLNRRLLVSQISAALRSLPELPVVVTTIPVVADLIGVLPARRWVYYCVDDFGEWPGLDQKALQCMETKLIERADVFIAASEILQNKLAQRGRSSHLLTHGVELDYWTSQPMTDPWPELQALERPLVVFWGVVDRRLDLAYLRRLASDLKQGTIVLVGPAADPDTELHRIPRIRCLGETPYERLPRVASEASVLIMPYADLPVTRAMQPLKLKEYLATGKPAVVSDLPANRPWAHCMDVAGTPETFSDAVRLRINYGLPNEQKQARASLASEGWAEKAGAFEKWIFPSSLTPV